MTAITRTFPFPYRIADIAATFGNVIVARDAQNPFGGYAILVKSRDGWAIYAEGLGYADALASASAL